MEKCSIHLKTSKQSSKNDPETNFERRADLKEDRCERNSQEVSKWGVARAIAYNDKEGLPGDLIMHNNALDKGHWGKIKDHKTLCSSVHT